MTTLELWYSDGMNVVLISTYELGHQPFGLASPVAWLRAAGAHVTCFDLAVQSSDGPALKHAVTAADLVALYLPMHTATRLAINLLPRLRAWNPRAHVCCYGLYAPMNEAFLRELGVVTILGGEFEQSLVALYHRLAAKLNDGVQREPSISLERQMFHVPDRTSLPPLAEYAWLQLGSERRVAGYTEASRGCKHHCRHCPIVPVYNGQFRIVQREVVLADVRQQVAAGAQHITFGDPDFFNGPGHALPIVQALHAEFPTLIYDVTIKVEHLLRYAHHLPVLRDTGCVLVTSAVEAVDDHVLAIFDKRHSRADFIAAVQLLRDVGLALNPTFVTFTPWTSRRSYLELLELLWKLNLVEHVAPIQYAIRLLIPAGSKLLALPEVQSLIGAYDSAALCYPWQHPEPEMDALFAAVLQTVKQGLARRMPRFEIFMEVWRCASRQTSMATESTGCFKPFLYTPSRVPIPSLSEPWYC